MTDPATELPKIKTLNPLNYIYPIPPTPLAEVEKFTKIKVVDEECTVMVIQRLLFRKVVLTVSTVKINVIGPICEREPDQRMDTRSRPVHGLFLHGAEEES